ncbi:SET domain-containing protein [bacterium]|nr:SET domain-containing protein [bacterium]
MIHPDTALRFISPAVGHGLVATAPIPMGTVIWVQDALDQLLDPTRVAALPAAYDDLLARYTYGDAEGNRVLIWDLGRQMNHSCQPNCLGTLHGFEVAIRDIRMGEQLTNDYGTFEDHREDDFFPCHCGAPGCRRNTRSSLSSEQLTALEAQLRLALTLTPSVPQPLASLLSPERLQAASEKAGYPAAEAVTLRHRFQDAHLPACMRHES